MTSIVVRSPARIACSLLDLNGEFGRVDGTLGFAVDDPFVEVVARQADQLECKVDGPVQPATQSGIELATRIAGEVPRVTIELTQWIEPHVGLGHKTQTVLAVALACLRAAGRDVELGQLVSASGRGGTSGAGIHTFIGGGIVVDAGHRFGPLAKSGFAPSSAATTVGPPPLVTRAFPADNLRVVLGSVPRYRGLSDQPEVDFFSTHCPLPRWEANEVIANVYMRLLPGLLDGDLEQICRGIASIQESQFKRLIWNNQSEPIKRVGSALRKLCPNVGLSSMGPTMYTITDVNDVDSCVQAYRKQFDANGLPATVISTKISERGASAVQSLDEMALDGA